MEIVGSVPPEEVPSGTIAFGVWTRLGAQVIEAHKQGKVLVIKAKDRAEQKKMINGMSEILRKAGYSRQFVSVDEPDGSITVYCQLAERPTSVLVKPLQRKRRRANA